MKFFLDTADVEEIKKAVEQGLCDGVTTNPTIILRSGRNQEEVVKEIAKIVDGPISVEGVGDTAEEIVKEAEEYTKWAKNIVVKVPMTKEGIKAVKLLESKGVKTNVTLVFSASQALIAAKAGASYISPFVGRLDDVSEDGISLIYDIVQMLDNYDFKSEIIVASVRHPLHVTESAKAGADIVTVPPSILNKLWNHPLTEKGIIKFKEDYKKSSGGS